jgi:arylsulfatase A-like enzyme
VPKGKRDASLCHLMDIAATVCDLAGAPLAGVEGRNLLKGVARRETYSAYRGFQRALRTRDWKLIRYKVNGAKTTQLFDLRHDPWETNNLASSARHQPRVREMTARLETLLTAAGDHAWEK